MDVPPAGVLLRCAPAAARASTYEDRPRLLLTILGRAAALVAALWASPALAHAGDPGYLPCSRFGGYRVKAASARPSFGYSNLNRTFRAAWGIGVALT